MDDEDMVGEIACQMLKYLGFEAVWVADGTAAIKEYSRQKDAGQPYAAIIMDLTIPGGMGGLETVAEIRKLDMEIPVIVFSGYSDDPVMKNPGGYGFTAGLSKPFTNEELSEMLNSVMR